LLTDLQRFISVIFQRVSNRYKKRGEYSVTDHRVMSYGTKPTKATSMRNRNLFAVTFFLISQVINAKSDVQLSASYWEKSIKKIAASSVQITGDEGKSKTISCSEFYLQQCEISNREYLYYLSKLWLTGDSVRYQNALPDTLVWRDKLAYNEPYVEYYFRHPAYSNYPVVGVSYTQALHFCEWLTASYNSDSKRKFKEVKFSLPAEDEWMIAAMGKLQNAIFPWGGPYIRNSKGLILANCVMFLEAAMKPATCSDGSAFQYQAQVLNSIMPAFDYADVTAPVKSYFPNGYDLYCMSGNVEEFVMEEGISKGGSWRDVPYFLRIATSEKYTADHSSSAERGFRVKMTVIQN